MEGKDLLVALVLVLLVLLIGRCVWPYGECHSAACEGFAPIPVSTCGAPRGDEYGVDMTGRNAAGTVVWDPYSTQSRVSLERGAETPEALEPLNPYTGLGKTSSVRAMGDRYRRNAALVRLSKYEHQPGDPGFMEEKDDGEMSLLRNVAKRTASIAPGPPQTMLMDAAEGSQYLTDGPYGDAVLDHQWQ